VDAVTTLCVPETGAAATKRPMKKMSDLFTDEERKQLNYLGSMLHQEPTKLHGVRTEKVIVFFHGYSSSPQQFRQLGERFYQLGYNVLVPLLPHHGMADRKLDNLSRLRAEELRDCADTSVDIAAGLGDKVFVGGLSAGGVIAGWIAQIVRRSHEHS
jgi:esterase/lipase